MVNRRLRTTMAIALAWTGAGILRAAEKLPKGTMNP
jgi:hypothetical protein